MPSYSQMKTADFNYLVADCEFVSSNISLDYDGYYESHYVTLKLT